MVKAKQIVTILLLVFVAASVVALVMKGTGGESEAERAARTAAETAAAENSGNEQPAGEKTAGDDSKIIAYYFHGNARCRTCLTIEMYALEAIEAGFPEALKAGGIEFLPVNLEVPGNQHFIDDFQLAARTVVLERIVGGERGDYVNLSRVWELVRDKEAFVAYIQDETEKFINGES